jgi:hypothetical protein
MTKIKIETEVSQSHYDGLKTLTDKSGQSIPELLELIVVDWFHSQGDEQIIEEHKIERNLEVVGDFVEHLKNNCDIEIQESDVLSFFNT